MGQSAGAGSPVWFMCYRERQSRGIRDYLPGGWVRHRIKLTGRTRPYKPPKGSARGTRSTGLSREYECSCGHVGWSNHMDLERMERA
jgi:hypothetical protein